jgi:hypothetical protein
MYNEKDVSTAESTAESSVSIDTDESKEDIIKEINKDESSVIVDIDESKEDIINKIEVATLEPIIPKCGLQLCNQLVSDSKNKYCELHLRDREHTTTIYKPQYKGAFMKSTGFIFDVNRSRYRPDHIPGYTSIIIGKVVNDRFTKILDDDEIQYCKDVNFEYIPEKPQRLVRCNINHPKVCDLCFKFCVTVESNVDGSSKLCERCQLSDAFFSPESKRAWELVGVKCECKRCQDCDEEEDYFDPYLYPNRFETEPRIKCKIPNCSYHIENKGMRMCSICEEGRLVPQGDPNGIHRLHIDTLMVLEDRGQSKIVIGKLESVMSRNIVKEVTSFDVEVMGDFGWSKKLDVPVVEVCE